MTETSLAVRGVAHDLNNQLMVLLNCLDRMIVLAPELTDAKQAMTAAERCAELTSQLLPRARRRKSARLSIGHLVPEAVTVIRSLLPDYTELEFDCRTTGCIQGEAAEIQQVLLNLCLNAVDAMNGPGVIRILAEESGREIILSVSDTGPGVPEKLLDRIFEPLFTTNAARGGNGLGLARVREIIERLGGRVSVRDVAPHGACFQLHLPAH